MTYHKSIKITTSFSPVRHDPPETLMPLFMNIGGIAGATYSRRVSLPSAIYDSQLAAVGIACDTALKITAPHQPYFTDYPCGQPSGADSNQAPRPCYACGPRSINDLGVPPDCRHTHHTCPKLSLKHTATMLLRSIDRSKYKKRTTFSVNDKLAIECLEVANAAQSDFPGIDDDPLKVAAHTFAGVIGILLARVLSSPWRIYSRRPNNVMP